MFWYPICHCNDGTICKEPVARVLAWNKENFEIWRYLKGAIDFVLTCRGQRGNWKPEQTHVAYPQSHLHNHFIINWAHITHNNINNRFIYELFIQYHFIFRPVWWPFMVIKIQQSTVHNWLYTSYSSHNYRHLPVDDTIWWCHTYSSYSLQLTVLLLSRE